MSSEGVSGSPTVEQRLAARERPKGPAAMYQRWTDLLFLHWEFPVETVQRTLPEGLRVDTFGGKAYVGIVPFFMRDVRPRFLPAVNGLSNFMELNLRTYVYDSCGVPGVWFYSLDANQWLAVTLARRFFHLPYEHAKMDAARSVDGVIHYESVRKGASGDSNRCVYDYRLGKALPCAAPGSLEFFLVERYSLYASSSGRNWRGVVHHAPYEMRQADVVACDEHLLALDGFEPTGRPPDHAIASPGVDVTIFPLRRV